MNRRTLIQAIGLTPFATLLSSNDASANTEKPVDDWGAAKIFSLQAPVTPEDLRTLHRQETRNNESFALYQEAPFFKRLGTILRNVTKTPNIFADGHISFYRKDGSSWGQNPECWGPDRESIKLDTADLFRSPERTIGQAFAQRSYSVAVDAYGYERLSYGQGSQSESRTIHRTEPDSGYAINHDRSIVLLDHRKEEEARMRLYANGHEDLASFFLSFMYYGPPPYQGNEIRRFDYATETWVPRSHGPVA